MARKGIGVDRDDIISMARETWVLPDAHIPNVLEFANLVMTARCEACETLFNQRVLESIKFNADVRKFDAAIKAEREACALEVEKAGIEGYGTLAAAAAIRARGDYGL